MPTRDGHAGTVRSPRPSDRHVSTTVARRLTREPATGRGARRRGTHRRSLPAPGGLLGRPRHQLRSGQRRSGDRQAAAGAGGRTRLYRRLRPTGTPHGRAPPAGRAIIYTASLTVRAGDIRAAATRAARLAGAAGGYVSGETARFSRRNPAEGTILIQLKIPVTRYQATLTALSARLGARISLSQHARDVTQTVADVTSRVASAKAGIAQLRRLLARAGSSAACSRSRSRSMPRSPTWRRSSPSSARWRTRPRMGPCR